MEQLNNLDVVFLIIVGISALVGIARGMTKEILSITGWVLAAAALYFLVPIVDPIMQQYIASKLLSSIVSGMAVLIVFCIIWLLTVDRLAAIVRSSKLSAMDRIFGFVFGLARGALIVVLIAMLITALIPEQSKEGMFAKSQYFNMASAAAEPLKAMVPDSWVDTAKKKMAEYAPFKKDEAKEVESAGNEKADTEKKAVETVDKAPSLEDQLRQAADAVENLKALQQSGAELFEALAQPRAASEDANEATEDLGSDLDQLLEILEDRVVLTDENTEEVKSESQKVEEKVKEKVAE